MNPKVRLIRFAGPNSERYDRSEEPGRRLSDVLMEMSPDRWGNSHVELQRTFTGEVIPLESAPDVLLRSGDDVTVRVLPAAFAALGPVFGTFVSIFVKVAISFAFNALLGSLGSKKAVSGPEASPARDSPSPLNQLQQQRNRPRLGARIPDVYGEMRTWPDLIFPSYSFWTGRDQELQAVYCIGTGLYDVSNVRIGETSISEFSDATLTVYPPGTSIPTSFNLVRETIELQNLTLQIPRDGGTWTDWYRLRGTAITQIWVEISLPRGSVRYDDRGQENEYTHSLDIQFRSVNLETGARGPAQNSSWSETLTDDDPRIYTHVMYPSRADAYEVRFIRKDNDEVQDGESIARGIDIRTAYSYTVLTTSQRRNDNATIVHLQVSNNVGASTNTINSQSRMNLWARRHLRTIDSGGNYGSSLQPTRRWCDAMAHMIVADENAYFPETELDFASLLFVQRVMESRASDAEDGYFDAVFDQLISVDDQVQAAAQVARAVLSHNGSQVVANVDRKIDVDEFGVPIPEGAQVAALFNRRNRSSEDADTAVSLKSRLPNEADGIELTWFDRSSNFLSRRLVFTTTGYVPINPQREDAIGMTKFEQVWRHASYLWHRNLYRRRSTSVRTFADARLLDVNSVVSVVQPWREEVSDGEIVDYDGSLTITLDYDAVLPPNPMIRIRSEDGKQTELIPITPGASPRQVVLDRVPQFTIIDGQPTGQIGHLYAITTDADDASDRWQVTRVNAQRYDGNITLVNYDERVFVGDVGDPGPAPLPPFDPPQFSGLPEGYFVFRALSDRDPPLIIDDGEVVDGQIVYNGVSTERWAGIQYGNDDAIGAFGTGFFGSRDHFFPFQLPTEKVYFEIEVYHDDVPVGTEIPTTAQVKIVLNTQSVPEWDGNYRIFEDLAVSRDPGDGGLRVFRRGIDDTFYGMGTPGASPFLCGTTIMVAIDPNHQPSGSPTKRGAVWYGSNGGWHGGGDPADSFFPTAYLYDDDTPEKFHWGIRFFQFIILGGPAADTGKLRAFGITHSAHPRAGKYTVPAGFVFAGEMMDNAREAEGSRDPIYPGAIPVGTRAFRNPQSDNTGINFDFDVLGDYFRKKDGPPGYGGPIEARQALTIDDGEFVYSRFPQADYIEFNAKVYFEIAYFNDHDPLVFPAELNPAVRIITRASGLSRTSQIYRDAAMNVLVDRGDYGAAGENTGLTLDQDGDYIMVAADIDANRIWYGVNGVWAFGGVPSSGTNPSSSAWLAGDELAGYEDWNFHLIAKLVDGISDSTLHRYRMQAKVHQDQGFGAAVPSGFQQLADYVSLQNPWPRESRGWIPSFQFQDQTTLVDGELYDESFVSDGVVPGGVYVRADVGIPPYDPAGSFWESRIPTEVDFGTNVYFEIELLDDAGGPTLPDDMEFRFQPSLFDGGTRLRANDVVKRIGQIFEVYRRQPYGNDAFEDADILHGVLWPNPTRFMFAAEPDMNRYWVGVNGQWLYSGNPESEANPTSAFYSAGDLDVMQATDIRILFNATVGEISSGITDYRLRAIIHPEQTGAGTLPLRFIWLGDLVQT